MATQTEKTESLVSNLPTFMQLDSDSNNYKFLNSFSPEFNVSEEGIHLLKASLYIDEAIGDDLDNLGKLFNIVRASEEMDEAFRGRIKAFFQTAIKSGSEIGLKESLINSLGINISDIIIITVQNNIFDLYISINIGSDLSIFNNIISIVEAGKAAGIYFRTFDLDSQDDIFLTEISYVDGKDLIL